VAVTEFAVPGARVRSEAEQGGGRLAVAERLRQHDVRHVQRGRRHPAVRGHR
jgi:hypothetical protein